MKNFKHSQQREGSRSGAHIKVHDHDEAGIFCLMSMQATQLVSLPCARDEYSDQHGAVGLSATNKVHAEMLVANSGTLKHIHKNQSNILGIQMHRVSFMQAMCICRHGQRLSSEELKTG